MGRKPRGNLETEAGTGELVLGVPRASLQPTGPVLATLTGRGWETPVQSSHWQGYSFGGDGHPSTPTSTGTPQDCLGACTSAWEMGSRF